MVARTPPKSRSAVAALDPVLLRETVKKVDKCLDRLEEMQDVITGGNKRTSGINSSPRSSTRYLKINSLRCKQKSSRKSPTGKFPSSPCIPAQEWRTISLPAMLVNETVQEIMKASAFTKLANQSSSPSNPKTPLMDHRRKQNLRACNIPVQSKKEKQKISSSSSKIEPSSLRRGGTQSRRINFNTSSLSSLPANHSKSRAKQTALFPNPLFTKPGNCSQQERFFKTRSPVIVRRNETTSTRKLLVNATSPLKRPPATSRRRFPIGNHSARSSPPKRMLCCRSSFSPSKLASRFLSPIKINKRFLKCSP